MTTNVSFHNGAPGAVQLVTTVIGGLDAAAYTVHRSHIEPGEKVVYLSFNRSSGITDEATFSFVTVFGVGDIQCTVTIGITGSWASSSFWVSLEGRSVSETKRIGPLADRASGTVDLWFTTVGSVYNSSTAATYATRDTFGYRIGLRRTEAGFGGFFDDVVVTLDPIGLAGGGNLVLPDWRGEGATPATTRLDYIDLLDVWGEGRIVTSDGLVTGFTEAYNLNHRDQRISNGPNTDLPIPNLIWVSSYDAVLFPLQDDCVRFVTVMGAPIVESVAREIRRVIDESCGVVYLYNPDPLDKARFDAVFTDVYSRTYVAGEPISSPFDQPTPRPVVAYSFQTHIHDEL